MSTILQGDYTPDKIVGPTLTGGFVQGILQGILACQMMDFFASQSGDTLLLRSSVVFVNGISLCVSHIFGKSYHLTINLQKDSNRPYGI